jgi:MFS family permease
MSLWAMGTLFGPILGNLHRILNHKSRTDQVLAGPICGGFLSAAAGWRWIFWVLAIAIAVVSAVALFTIDETYHPVLLERKTARLRKETGNPNLRSKLEQNLTPKEVFIRAITRPTKLLLFSPICGLMSLYMAVVYGILYLLFTTFTFVFQESYGFSESTVGLTYIGLGLGNFIGLAALGYSSDKVLKHMTEKNGGKGKPEYRLPPLIWGSPFIPAGLFIYGWTAQYSSSIHWAVPLFGTLLVGIGMIAAFMAVNTYLIDAFTMYAASAMAAITILRSV